MFVRITIEGRIAAKEDVGDDPDTPNIAAFGVFPIEYLGGHVVGRAYLGVHDAHFHVIVSGEAKVNDFDDGVFFGGGEEEVFRL